MQKLSLRWALIILTSSRMMSEEHNVPHEPIASLSTHVSIPHIEENTEHHRVGSPHLRPRNSRLSELREEVTQDWAKSLKHGAAYWYTVGKVFDGTGQLCTYATPLLSALAAALKSQSLAIAATVMGVSAVAAHRMGRYASNESSARMGALNRIFVQEGVPPGITIGDGSSSGSNGD